MECNKPLPLMLTIESSPYLTVPLVMESSSKKTSRDLIMWLVALVSKYYNSVSLSSSRSSCARALAWSSWTGMLCGNGGSENDNGVSLMWWWWAIKSVGSISSFWRMWACSTSFGLLRHSVVGLSFFTSWTPLFGLFSPFCYGNLCHLLPDFATPSSWHCSFKRANHSSLGRNNFPPKLVVFEFEKRSSTTHSRPITSSMVNLICQALSQLIMRFRQTLEVLHAILFQRPFVTTSNLQECATGLQVLWDAWRSHLPSLLHEKLCFRIPFGTVVP